MHSFLIISKDKNQALTYALDFLEKKEIDYLDIDKRTYEKAIGIGDIRDIQKSAFLKPFRSKTKAVVIDTYTDITLEAQNALLKILEEPPGNTIIALIAPEKELFLATIISRCKVIALPEKDSKLTQEDIDNLNMALDSLINGKTASKLKIAQDVAKEDPELWLTKMAIILKRKLIHGNADPKHSTFLKGIQRTYKLIKSTNVSPRTALENLFLSL